MRNFAYQLAIGTMPKVAETRAIKDNAVSDIAIHMIRVAEISARQTADALSRRLGEVVNVVASGEDVNPKYGAWVSFSGGNSQYNFASTGTNLDKTKGTNSTIMVGTDVKLYDTYTIGAAVSIGKTSLKTSFKDSAELSSATDKLSVIVGSIYGSMPIIENLILKGSFSGGQIKVKGDSLDNRKGSIYSGDLSATYYYDINDGIIVAPSLGASAAYIKLGSTKADADTDPISKMDVKRYGVNVGLAISKAFNVKSFAVKPEAFIKANYYPVTKSKKLSVVNSNDIVVENPSTKVLSNEKSSYSAGASLSVVNIGMMDISVGYVRDWQKRYKANTGFAKVRINF